VLLGAPVTTTTLGHPGASLSDHPFADLLCRVPPGSTHQDSLLDARRPQHRDLRPAGLGGM
jgi:hypothetical protein